jgi:uncharacterized membrane protein
MGSFGIFGFESSDRLVVLDTLTWESSAGFRLESSHAVQFYARNDHMELTIRAVQGDRPTKPVAE